MKLREKAGEDGRKTRGEEDSGQRNVSDSWRGGEIYEYACVYAFIYGVCVLSAFCSSGWEVRRVATATTEPITPLRS